MSEQNAAPEGAGKKRVSIKTVDAAKLEKGIYSAKFTDGTVVECAIADIPESVREAMLAKFLSYGLKQKLDDSMAGAENVKTAIEELTSTWGAILKGGWVSRVPGEGVEGGLFARAYAKRHDMSLAESKEHIGKLVEKNLAANRAKYAGQDNAPEITDRMVFNRIRDTALERDADLAKIYEDLKNARKKKESGKVDMDVDLSA